MQYFALTAVKGKERERSCALIDAPTIEDAAARARRLKDDGFLSFVKPGSTYAIRAASRRETQLLQKFLQACNRADARIHMQSDFDGLLARRQSLLLSFFMGMYLAPEKIRQIADGGSASTPRPLGATNASGSGGVEMSSEASLETEPTQEQGAPEGGTQQDTDQADEEVEAEASDEPIDASSQNDMLASILNDPSSPTSGGDLSIDLGDDEVL